MRKHKTMLVNLHTMCSRYGKPPCDYLFPQVECPHFRLLVDTAVFNIGEPELLKSEIERTAIAGGAKLLGGL